jgi:hypothetical protein
MFKAGISKTIQKNLTFGLGKSGRINLLISPAVVDPRNKMIGGDNLAIGFPELDSVLTILKWDNKTIKRYS